MNAIWANLIGYLFAVIIAHFPIALIQNALWRDLSYTAGQDIRPRAWHATIIGVIERTLYIAALQASAAYLIGVWLALKAASQWKGWSEGLQVSLTGGRITGRELANVFITGTGLSILFALAGSRCIPHLVGAEWSKASLLLIGPLIGAPVLYLFVCKNTRRRTMKCTVVKQRPNHCVPACLESIAKDAGISITQSDIVRRFASVFPGGVLNDENKSPNLEDVVRDLGLADSICQIQFQGLEHLAELQKENEILLMWSDPAKHCVRVCSCDVASQLVTVMDPARDELQMYDIPRLKSLNLSLVFFKRRRARR